MVIMKEKSRRLRAALQESELVHVAGAHNGLGARLVENNGFDAVWASGFELSTSYALPDMSILTMTEYLNAARAMNDAVDIPIVADCDTGFGDRNNVAHMARQYEAAGVAAVCIEDKRFPKLNSFADGHQDLEDPGVFADKIAAGKGAQRGTDFMIIARIESFVAGAPVDEALRRARLYAEAGADAILVHSKSAGPHEVFGFMARWDDRVPVVVVPTSYYRVRAEELVKNRIRMVIYANQAIRASVQAMDETLGKIRKHAGTAAVEPAIASMRRLFALQGMTGLVKEPTIDDRTDGTAAG